MDMNEEGNGFPIYRMNEMENMLCSSNVLKYAPINASEADAFILRDGDVLFNRTNSQVFVGRTGIYKPFDEAPRVFASYLIRLIPNPEKVLPEYLTAFLNSTLGVMDVKRRARISINQSNVNAEEVKAVRIPLLNIKLQQEIAKLFSQAHTTLIESAALYTQAETLLLDALGLRDWQPPQPLTYESLSSTAFAAGRLDAEHFQPQYAALLERLQACPGGHERLGKLCPDPVNGVEVREYQEEGVPYLRVGDIRHFSVNLETVKQIAPTAAADEIEKVRLRVGDLLVSRSGSLGVVGVVEPAWEHAVISSHLIRVRIEEPEFDPYYVAAFLSSRLGKMQIVQHSNGGVQPEINQPALRSIVIPKLSALQQEQIRDTILSAHTARRKAKGLLEAAKRAVEIAIETDEAAALAYLRELTP